MTWFDVIFYGAPGPLAYAIHAAIKRWFVPWYRRRWPARQGAFVDPDKYSRVSIGAGSRVAD